MGKKKKPLEESREKTSTPNPDVYQNLEPRKALQVLDVDHIGEPPALRMRTHILQPNCSPSYEPEPKRLKGDR